VDPDPDWIHIRIGSGFRDFVDPDPYPGARKLRKERGQDPLYYMYLTVFVRNAAYLTQLLTKASKIRNWNKKFNFRFDCPFWGPSK
jgi:hypothetical protein